MARFKACPHCNNSESGYSVYRCKDCGKYHCRNGLKGTCRGETSGHHCPSCDSYSIEEKGMIGEVSSPVPPCPHCHNTDWHFYVYKCSKCGNAYCKESVEGRNSCRGHISGTFCATESGKTFVFIGTPCCGSGGYGEPQYQIGGGFKF